MSFFEAIFAKIATIKEDFEVKRFMLGLSSFLVNTELPESVRSQYPNIIKALAYLGTKSIELRQKALESTQKAEMAEVEEHGEQYIAEDEEDTIIDIDSDDEDEDYEYGDDEEDGGIDSMYDSPLDKVDEVLHFHQQLGNLQQAGGQELHAFLMQQLDQAEIQQIEYSLNAAQSF